MTYSYQSFSSGNILTNGQAQQIEDNVRDHVHGYDGVGASGVSWDVSSAGSAFTVNATDAAKLFKCYGDFEIAFQAAATLGGNFGAGFVNMGSGRVILSAAAGGYIHQHSYYALTPGEGVSVHSDNSDLMVMGGQNHARIYRQVAAGSLAQIDVKAMWAGDFERYELHVKASQSATGLITLLTSVNSGSSYLSSGYADTDADTTAMRLWRANTSSNQAILSVAEFVNNALVQSMGAFFKFRALRGSAGSVVDEYMVGGQQTTVGNPTGLRVQTNAGNFLAGTTVELFGIGRPRR
ncbi:MAG: hypothetical protein HC889_00730 [Synechococcaceae cyanobacterium SM1_2_3]|nr:hypothetical protein [Synechococcaceae cyanobacterium SM1_2_3]